MQLNRGDASFVSKRFSNWKDGTIGLKNHKASASHKEALQTVIVLPITCPDIGDMMSKQHADSKKLNREYLLKIPDPPRRSMLHMQSVLRTLSDYSSLQLQKYYCSTVDGRSIWITFRQSCQ